MSQDISSSLANRCRAICGAAYVFTDRDSLHPYGSDQTGGLHFPFEILVKPGTPAEIAALLTMCNELSIPITPRGGGSGVTGGALPVKGGIVLSLERLNRVLEVNTAAGFVVAEAGTITADLCRAVEKENLYFPVIPTSSTWCMIGGNVAENAGSIRSCKYGTTGNYVLNLEVVLPSGDIIWTGANVAKNATGLNLTQLFAGSEGILGIITKVVFKLIPLPVKEMVIRAAFSDLGRAWEALVAIRRSRVFPSAVELIARNAIEFAAARRNAPLPLTEKDIEAYLLIELQQQDGTLSDQSLETLSNLLEQYTAQDILVADTAAAIKELWRLRDDVGSALANCEFHYRDLDVAVPLSELYDYTRKVNATCAEYGITTVCFGHALDGNLHTMLICDGPDADEKKLQLALQDIYTYAISKGGVISGEHGIGYLQKEFIPLQFSPPHLALLKKIKTLFDPKGILNPGKVF